MREWSNLGQDNGSIHAIGNGNMLIYEQGPNIINVFGPPYSAPSFLKMSINEQEKDIRVISERENGTAIWHHSIKTAGVNSGKIIDFILADKNVFFREIKTEEEINLKIVVADKLLKKIINNFFRTEKGMRDCIQLIIPKGSTFAADDSVNKEINMLIVVPKDAMVEMTSAGEILIRIPKGNCKMFFSAGEYPEIIEQIEYVLKNEEKGWIEESRFFWNEFTSRRMDFKQRIPENNTYKKAILDAIDSVSVLIKCQQSSSGGVSAGHYYPLAYVRDQVGVIRGLLALGYIEEAKQIIEFRNRKWQLFGDFCDAEGMGNDCARLMLGNDEVEIPAYIILVCFIYFEHTKDDDFLNRMFPMMESAFEVQLGHIVEGMTEFSADETYIAGYIFPRYCMFHGSAESTLLFIQSSEKLLDWARKNKKWSDEKLEKYTEVVSCARNRYKQNFVLDGKFFANNPLREEIAGKPRFRYSFCDNHMMAKNEILFTWCTINSEGYYVCSECRDEIMPEFQDKNKRYVLNSVSLVPGYIGSDILTKDEIEKIVAPIVETFKLKGLVPSQDVGTRSLGYDYGLLLYNLVKLNHPAKEEVLKKTLSLLDPTGAWVEYYDNDKPYNCRARPWESAINIEAIIEYIKTL